MEYKIRHLEKRITEAAKAFKVVIVLGARQVGKSTLLRHLWPDVDTFLFDSVLDPYRVREDPDLFLDLHPPPLLLDEVQFVPGLLSSIKRHIELMDRTGLYFLTGSQNLMILKTVSETMTGRAALLHMEGMTLAERSGIGDPASWLVRYLRDPHAFMDERTQILPNIPSLPEVIWRGSFPQSIGFPRSEVPLFFSSYIQTYVERDLRLIEKIEDLYRYGEFLSLLGALTGQEINYSQLGREINMTPQTSRRWLFALSASYLWREILPLTKNMIKRLSEKRKGILTDSGIACHLLRVQSPEDLTLHPSLGALFETWVINHICQLFSSLQSLPGIYHWRTHSGAELDLVLELNGTYFPIEIKCSKNISSFDLRSFKAFRENYTSQKIAPGLIIYAGDENYLIDRQTKVLSWKAC